MRQNAAKCVYVHRRAPRSLRAHLTRATLRAVVVTLFPACYLGAQAAMEAGYRAMGLA